MTYSVQGERADLACVAGGIREGASGRATIFATLHQSSQGFATRVHGDVHSFASKPKALAPDIPPATQARVDRYADITQITTESHHDVDGVAVSNL